MKNKNFFIIVGLVTVMLAFTIIQILLFRETSASDLSSAARALAIRTNAINILLGAGGMCVLLFLGNKVVKKLNTLEELIRPLEKKDYSVLALFSSDSHSPGRSEETYGEFKKAAGDLGKFIETFRAHARSNAGIEEILQKIIQSSEEDPEDTGPLARRFEEIESAAQQAASVLDQLENYFSSLNEKERGQSKTIEEVETRLAASAELEQVIANIIVESGKKAGELKDKTNDGEEQSRNAYDIIKATSKDLEKITDLTQEINKIAEQTNILSMNAAIESAHAGEAGAGFAVVADEMRKLAESTRENANNIQDVLLAITRQISSALKTSEISSVVFSTITAEIAGFTGTLGTAAENARKSSEINAEIKTVLEEVSNGAGKTQNTSVDIAASVHGFRSVLENIQSLSGKDKTEAGNTGNIAQGSTLGSTQRLRTSLEESLDKVRGYLKETEKLRDMLSSKPAPLPANTAAAQPPVEMSAKVTGTDSAATIRADPVTTDKPATEEIDNSWRKDVAVKSPPKTVR